MEAIMTIHIVDANNHVRRRLEAGGDATPVRTLITDIDYMDGPVIYVWDGYHAKKSRQDIYSGYKAKRSSAGESIYETFKLLKALLVLTRAIQIEVPHFEADDIIAQLAIEQRDKGEDVYIHSNDGDFLQISGVRQDREDYKGIPAQHVRIYKATKGDSSDCIPGIAGFGDGAWASVANHSGGIGSLYSLIQNGSAVPDDVPLTPRVRKWITDPENVKQLQIYWRIVGFLSVPDKEVKAGMTLGKPNRVELEKILDHFMI
jgi:hypothetical protein